MRLLSLYSKFVKLFLPFLLRPKKRVPVIDIPPGTRRRYRYQHCTLTRILEIEPEYSC